MSLPAPPLPPSELGSWPPAWTPEAVVLDCDGLLVDTESYWAQLQDEYLAAHGTAFDAATRRAVTARTAEEVVLAVSAAVDKAPDLVAQELMAAHRTADRGPEPIMPGAHALVTALAARVPVAVASNSPRDLLEEKLVGMGLLEVVDAFVGVEDVTSPKPAPDLYVVAAERLGADPARCLAFEDSEVGAVAALGAGMQLIAVPSVSGQQPRAHRTLDSLEDAVLTSWVDGWERRR